MAGTLVVDTVKSSTTSPPAFQNSSGAAVGALCRAWCNYNGTTQTILASFNVSSVTYSSAGIHIINFTNPMPDANYAVTGALQADNTNNYANTLCVQTTVGAAKSASAFAYRGTSAGNGGVAVADYVSEMIAVFR